MFLINFYNQKGAGPKNISLNFIHEIRAQVSESHFLILVPDTSEYRHLETNPRTIIISLPCPKTVVFKGVYRAYLELFFIPRLVKKHQINSILAFGNFLFSPIKVRKTVLLHHPYLVDDKLLKNGLAFKARLIENLKRVAFFFTTKMVDTVVVQSGYMKEMLVNKYPNHKFAVEVIPNPISTQLNTLKDLQSMECLIDERVVSLDKTLNLLYVSRFYPHKNHIFLIALSKRLNALGIQHNITVTVDPSIFEAKDFLATLKEPDVSIINLTEIEQAQLIEHYRNAHFFIFPSLAETFGNPLIEAMCYGLPILVPDLEYAHSVVGDAGTYYQEDNASDALEKIKMLVEDKKLYLSKSKQALEQFNYFPTTPEWIEHYISLLR